MKRSILIALAGVISFSFMGCGRSYDLAKDEMCVETAAADNLYAAEAMDMEESYATADGQAETTLYENRKLIKTVNLDAETEDYDSLLPNIEKKVNELGGYIENYTTSGRETQRYANITARIPVAKLNQFVDDVAQVSNIVYRNEYVEDVTLTYVDLQSHRDMLKAEQSKLMELMEQAETMEDIIALESRLTEVRYELESMESQLRTYDNQIDYSTVTIAISEVEKVTPPVQMSAGEKMMTGFVNNVERIIKGMKTLAMQFVINLPFLFLFAIIVLIIVVIIKVILRICEKNKKSDKMPQDKKNSQDTK